MAHRSGALIFLPSSLPPGSRQPGNAGRAENAGNRTEIPPMAINRKRKKGARKVVRSRDPFWRLRRALGGSRVESGRAYRRAAVRAAARKEIDDG